jgi:hypothetical protein
MKINAFNIAMPCAWPPLTLKIVRIMKLTTILMLFALLQVGAKGFGQITLSQRNVSLETALRNIEKQTDYVFFYPADLNGIAVNVQLNNVPLKEALDACLKNLPFSFKVVKKTVVISAMETDIRLAPYQLSGKITDSLGLPLPGAIVRVKGKETRTNSDSQGRYFLTVEGTDVLIFSYIGFRTQEIKVQNRRIVNVSLQEAKMALGEIVVTGMMDRTGDLFVLSARDVVVGKTAAHHDLKALDGTLRSHGGRYEEMVPLVISHELNAAYKMKTQGDPRNFDVFDFTVNGTH